MTSEITYAEVRFKNEPMSSASKLEAPAVSKLKTSPHRSNPGIYRLLLTPLLILLLLLAISFFVTFIIFFQKYSQLKEKKNSKEVIHTMLQCMKGNTTIEGKEWSCCPENWISFHAYCYFISTKDKNWTESEKNCSGMNAYLLVVHSKDKQDFISQKVNSKFAYYVGLSDPERKNNWQWVDQTPYNESATFWHPDEPSQPSDGCAVLLYRSSPRKWGWNDISCQETHRSICKMMKIYL
ncbi:C-type lectin domain family 4 member A [Erinaceus europaeus]|uniref:C-type lectin domain family 4 member A n=1 Tax=Erinaceus europaeus TaxID=9365 RepID=A0ABM3XBA9_ERIEU|nr:C-type lectin domain family 4 member A [Erinaceus europaeus]XP_060046111.1 C-type lectin domain family 4 member A [Erinaceus europaeus]